MSEPQSLHIRAEFARLAVQDSKADNSLPSLEESVNNSLSDSKNIQSSHSVLVSDREEERLTSSNIGSKNELNNQSVKIVPTEQISNDHSMKVNSPPTTLSSNDQATMQLPPPQPQRPPKQPKHVQSVSPAIQSNSGTANPQAPVISQPPVSAKQISPTQVKNNQSYSKSASSTQSSKFGTQQNKGSSPTVSAGSKYSAQPRVAPQQVSKQNVEESTDLPAVTKAVPHKVSPIQVQQISQLPAPQKLPDVSKSQTSLSQSGTSTSTETSMANAEKSSAAAAVPAKSDKILPQSSFAISKERTPVSKKEDSSVVSKKEISDAPGKYLLSISPHDKISPAFYFP